MFKRIDFLSWWPRRVAAILALASVAWIVHASAVPFWWAIGMAAVQLIAAIGLWYRRRWARVTTLVLQAALPLLGLLFAARVIAEMGWWLQQLPHVIIVMLLLVPEGRRSRAALRESGFEPGDTTPASDPRRRGAASRATRPTANGHEHS